MFLEAKYNKMKKLQYAVDNNLVDKEIMYFVDRINEEDEYYTTSSCIGRCGIMEFPKNVNTKIYSRWLGKWHHYATTDEMNIAIESASPDYDRLYFVLNSPIMHIACKDAFSAKKLLEIAYHNGLKASSIKSLSEKRYIVEFLTTMKLDAPIGFDGKLVVDDNYLNILLNESNLKLMKAREMLHRVYLKFDEEFSR
ncbi:tRNA(Phe) 7-((3-amino-3-carboxypropyl)-4-demethylwyosine(37)-N(4))-methyltransferase Taw3 [Methanococcus voltae]|uniref:tRNA(Phe) 7-((3-amino-3-carboxypropyl)-4-demethylwyosine(37)-N(4))-methyltransferase n=1 Tax=Methanococcus voltae (strain ATCC BAA-1334 / A3) TaxID=456320 RepID=D7DUS9_METV3|nr:hypothetical protein [Methanococcus voltae]MCS3900691.1 tRNA wybutosine-synthesizing protein 3 [Methanococcus voltae]